MYLILGIFFTINFKKFAIIARAESFASKNTWDKSVIDGLMMGVGFTLVLVLLGAMRELIGNGTLFDQADLIFGELGLNLKVILIDQYKGTLIALLPPGAFIGLGLIVALKNLIDSRKTSTQTLIAPQTSTKTQPI